MSGIRPLEFLSRRSQHDHSVQRMEQLQLRQKKYVGVIVNQKERFVLSDEYLVQQKVFHRHMEHSRETLLI